MNHFLTTVLLVSDQNPPGAQSIPLLEASYAYIDSSDSCKILLSVDSENVSFASFCGFIVSLMRSGQFAKVEQWQRGWSK